MNFKAFFVWTCGLIFLLFVNLRLDEKMLWSWFVVFIPLWVMDVIMILLPVLLVVKQRRRWRTHDLLRFAFYLTMVLLKTTAQSLICLKLEGYQIKSYYAMLPIWVCLCAIIVDVASFLRSHWQMAEVTISSKPN